MDKAFVIGIAGGSGSGKSTFAKKLKEFFCDDVVMISCDDYYLPHDDIPFEERTKLNYDMPEALDLSLLATHLKDLKAGKIIDCPIYDFSQHTRSSEIRMVSPRRIVIVDGILTFADNDLREQLDIKIYVEADADERVLRRLKRDVVERGRSIDSIIEQYLSTVKPMHNLYVEPTKHFADIIINGGMNKTAFDMVKTKIETILQIGNEK